MTVGNNHEITSRKHVFRTNLQSNAGKVEYPIVQQLEVHLHLLISSPEAIKTPHWHFHLRYRTLLP